MLRDTSHIDRYLRRRAILQRVAGAVLLVALASVLIGNTWREIRGGDDWSKLDRRELVVQAVQSGSRIVVEDIDGSRPTVVHLIGIDTFDVASHGQPQPYWAMESYREVRDRLQGKRVLVRLPALDPQRPDGSLRGYVYLLESAQPPAESVNEQLVASGHAYADRRLDHAYHKQFEQAEGDARRKKLGQWKDVRDDQQPNWRQSWLATLRVERAASK